MFKYACFIGLFVTQILFGTWDDFQGEQIVLFSLAPGIGDQFREQCQEQLCPTYFQKIANQNPEVKAKIIAIEPRFSNDHTLDIYTFLNDWERKVLDEENNGIIFKKDNIEIQCYGESIPESDTDRQEVENYFNRVENYFIKVINNGGVIFIGHHGQAYYAFEPFRLAYNNYNCESVQMYICCGDSPPFSSPKVYGKNSCCNEELSEFHDFLLPYWYHLIYLADKEGNEAAYEFLKTLMEVKTTSFSFYKDMQALPYNSENLKSTFANEM